MLHRNTFSALASLALTLAPLTTALALTPYDTPSVSVVRTTSVSVVLDVGAGPSGAPAGFEVGWMLKSDYDAYGWPADPYAYGYCDFTGVPTLHVSGGQSSFSLAPGAVSRVWVGSLFDETGVVTDYPGEMPAATEYVVRVRAEGDAGGDPSPYSANLVVSTSPSSDCVRTQGYWKNHTAPGDWPVTTLLLGTVSYNQAQLIAILGQPAAGNGLIFLAHQLIATKLNIAFGSDPTTIAATVAAADALIGGLVVPPVGAGFLSPASASALTATLDDYNNGSLGPPHCGPTASQGLTWGRIKSLYR